MAKAAEKKRGAPSQPCPKCGKPIHPRQKEHDCGWVRPAKEPTGETPSAIIKRGKPKQPVNEVGGAADLVKALEGLVKNHGAEKVKQAVDFLEKF